MFLPCILLQYIPLFFKEKKSFHFFHISARHYYAFSSLFHPPNSCLLELQNTHRRKSKFNTGFFALIQLFLYSIELV